MSYSITGIGTTIWGEGLLVGQKLAVVTFAGCNLWDGLPIHRDQGPGACALYCDAHLLKGDVLTVADILEKLEEVYPPTALVTRQVMFTGGEPLEQANSELVKALQDAGWRLCLETNGTVQNFEVNRFDHVTLSPKLDLGGRPLPVLIPYAHEVKVVQPGWSAAMLDEVARTWAGSALFLAPQDPLVDSRLVAQTALVRTQDLDEDAEALLDRKWSRNLRHCIDSVNEDPRWRLSIPARKLAGLP